MSQLSDEDLIRRIGNYMQYLLKKMKDKIEQDITNSQKNREKPKNLKTPKLASNNCIFKEQINICFTNF